MGIQEGARKLRYDWFDGLLSKFNFDYLVTAHHLDDQIETYLINSSRGSGINGLLGITSSSQKIFRPLLNILKIDILDYAQQNSVDYREDSSNSSEDYQRNMIRNSVLPTFNEFDDNVMLKFKTTINNLHSTKIFVDNIIEDTKNELFKIDSKSIKEFKRESASGNSIRILFSIIDGIDKEDAKKINLEIKKSKLKVKSQIQGDELRVSGQKRDDLQNIINLIKNLSLDIPVQFINFRD